MIEDQKITIKKKQDKKAIDEVHEITIKQTVIQEERQTYEAPSETQTTIKLEKPEKSMFLSSVDF